jgi:hypothetical protein
MKRIQSLLLGLALACSCVGSAFAQSAGDDIKEAGKATKKAATKTGSAVKKGSKKAVNKTAKKTQEGAAKVKDATK